ncbi:MAG: CoB--CoM heterodisulfide reductase iron-sulfur subunit B family protein [bacterium]
MSYLYFPGCSLKSTGRAYEESMLACFAKLDEPLEELEDWNCCGATAYMSISELKAFALSARNLALARQQSEHTTHKDLIVPCAACYLGLNKAHRYLEDYPDMLASVNEALADAGLVYTNNLQVRHPLDVLLNDIGHERLKQAVERPLTGLRVACYYGCQLVRPYADFDNQHNPQTMDTLLKTLGAEVIDWPLKTRCCGGSLIGTMQDVGLRLGYILLREAARRGANVVATACPLCQFTLECYQNTMQHRYRRSVNLPVAYFSQLLGLALGISERELGLQRLFVPLRVAKPTTIPAGGVHA